jgi:hypothetical protein
VRLLLRWSKKSFGTTASAIVKGFMSFMWREGRTVPAYPEKGNTIDEVVT